MMYGASAYSESAYGDFASAGVGVLLAPIADITAAGWLPSMGVDLFAMIDEAVALDSDYIYSPDNPTTQECEVKFAGTPDPFSSSGHVIRYRLSAIQATTFLVTLMCGATQIAQWTESVADAAPATFEHTLTGTQADNITDYSNLRIRFLASI